MKLRLLIGFCLLIASTFSLYAIVEEDFNKIVFINQLGENKTIEYLFFSPNDSDYWGPDVLAKEHVIQNGQQAEFFVFYPQETGTFQFMAIDNSGLVYEIDSIAIKDGQPQTVVITNAFKTDKKLESLNMTEILLSNETGKELDYVFLAPADSEMWGIELLNTERTLAAGIQVSFLVLLAGEKFEMDFLAIDNDGNNYEKSIPIGTEEDSLFISISPMDLNTE